MSASATRRLSRATIRGIAASFVLIAAFVCSIGIAAAQAVQLDVSDAVAGFDQRTKMPIVTVKLSEASKLKIAEITTKNVGRVMVLRVDGKEVLRPVAGGKIEVEVLP